MTELIRELKREGIIGDFVRVRRYGTILVRGETPRQLYVNGNMLQGIMHSYVEEKAINVGQRSNREVCAGRAEEPVLGPACADPQGRNHKDSHGEQPR